MDFMSLAEETKKLDAAIKDGSFSCVDVYRQDVKRNRLDWVNRKAHEMLEEGKNVLKVGLIESGAWEDSTKLKYQTLYFVGWDEMGEPCLAGRKPQGFVYTGTHKEICPVRANGHVKKGTMEVIDYKDSKYIIVDNLKDYDEALKATVGTERKILQVHERLPYGNKVSSLDTVRMIPEDSNLVIVNSTGRFDFVDEHIYDSVENYIDRKEKLDVLKNKHENIGELLTLEGFGKDKVNELGIPGFLYCERILDPHNVGQKVFVADDNVKLEAFDWNGNYAEKLMYEKTDIPGVYQSTLLTREGMEIGLVTLDPEKMGKLLDLKCVPAKDKKMSAELDLSDLTKNRGLEIRKDVSKSDDSVELDLSEVGKRKTSVKNKGKGM